MLSSEALRRRFAAVNWIFIGSSNELGAFESSTAASMLGTVPAVWLGDVATLLVVSLVAVAAPQLRQVNLDPRLHPASQAGDSP